MIQNMWKIQVRNGYSKLSSTSLNMIAMKIRKWTVWFMYFFLFSKLETYFTSKSIKLNHAISFLYLIDRLFFVGLKPCWNSKKIKHVYLFIFNSRFDLVYFFYFFLQRYTQSVTQTELNKFIYPVFGYLNRLLLIFSSNFVV